MDLKVLVAFAMCSILMIEASPVFISINTLENVSIDTSIGDSFYVTEEEETSAETSHNNNLVNKLKVHILHSLNLTEVPETHASPPPLQNLRFENDTSLYQIPASISHDDDNGLKSEFLDSDMLDETCLAQNGLPCIRFQIQLPAYVINGHHKSSEIWLHKKEGLTEFSITQIIYLPYQEDVIRKTVTVYNQTESASWQRFDASQLLNNSTGSFLTLEVSSNSIDVPIETGENNNPFLIVRTNRNVRTKRSSDCESNGNDTCCRKKFFLNFGDVAWAHFIVEPKGLDAYFCQGSCHGAFNLAYTSYAKLMLHLCMNSPRIAAEAGIQECVKCTPTSFKPISIIYLDGDGVKYKRNFLDLSVTKCTCT